MSGRHRGAAPEPEIEDGPFVPFAEAVIPGPAFTWERPDRFRIRRWRVTDARGRLVATFERRGILGLRMDLATAGGTGRLEFPLWGGPGSLVMPGGSEPWGRLRGRFEFLDARIERPDAQPLRVGPGSWSAFFRGSRSIRTLEGALVLRLEPTGFPFGRRGRVIVEESALRRDDLEPLTWFGLGLIFASQHHHHGAHAH